MIPEQTLLNYPLFGDNATKVEPDNNKKSNGWQQADVVPAEWMNWAWYHNSKGIKDLNDGVSSMEKEINAVLASFGITPAELTNNQLLTAMRLNASFVTATGTTITGPLLVNGATIRVMFTAAIAGTDTTTGLTLSYNGQNIPVKVGKNGAKSYFTAVEVSTGIYKYLQAYTMLELIYDGVDFIIAGNPVVLSDNTYIYYSDGSHVTNSLAQGNLMAVTANAVYIALTNYFVKNPTQIINEDLNDLTNVGLYYSSGSDNLRNKPADVANNLLFVFNLGVTSNRYFQVFFSANSGLIYYRWYQAGWNVWRRLAIA